MRRRTLPGRVVARFRALALERLDQIEAGWATLAMGPGDGQLVAEIARLAHTLRGDSRAAGFADVNLLCQKFEDVLLYARRRRFRVPDEVDVIATMALQFTRMLVRKPPGARLGGVDLLGFAREIDETLREARTHGPQERSPLHAEPRAQTEVALLDRLSATTRQRLAAPLTQVFLESLGAAAPVRERLQAAFTEVASEMAALEAIPLQPAVVKHLGAAADLAAALGRRVELSLDLGGVRAAPEVIDALDVVIVHGVRNALDHGIESPAARRAAGKPETGHLRIAARGVGDSIELRVEDDGRGVDLAAVRRRGLEMGLLPADRAVRAEDAELLALLFHPGFTTKPSAGDVSGRGIGLDAVRGALSVVSGTAEMSHHAGRGSSLVVRVPQLNQRLPVCRFASVRREVLLAVDTTWSVSELSPGAEASADLLDLLGPRFPRRVPSGAGFPGLRLRRGELALEVASSMAPEPAVAERILPTAATFPIEVVSIAGVEALWMRPERLPFLAAAARRRSRLG